MVAWRLVFTNKALKDGEQIFRSPLKNKAKQLLALLEDNPYTVPPPYEKLPGDLEGAYSRRINIQHRLVYQVFEKERAVKIIRLWTHYDA